MTNSSSSPLNRPPIAVVGPVFLKGVCTIRRLVISVCLLVAGPVSTASAHSPIKGIGTFYNGLLHPALVPAHLIALVAIGLMIGQRAPHGARRALPAFAAVVAFALASTLLVQLPVPQWVIHATSLVAGLAVALALPSGIVLPMLLAVAAGLFIGLDSTPDGIPEQQVWLALSGTAFGAMLAVTYVSGLVAWLDRPWQKIAIRAAGSWIAASAILVLALDVTRTGSPV